MNDDYKHATMNSYKHARELRGFTAEQVARELGITVKTLSNWETGKTVPSALMVIELCRVYRCSADALLGKATKGSYSPMRIQSLLTIEEAAECAGLPVSRLKELEQGADAPWLDEILDLCVAYDCSAIELLSEEEQASALLAFYQACTYQWRKVVLDNALAAANMSIKEPNVLYMKPRQDSE